MVSIALTSPLKAADMASFAGVPNAGSQTPQDRSDELILDEGKTLYARGQYMEALSRFMTILRRDPMQPEARMYLRQVIELLKKTPNSTASQERTAVKQQVTAAVTDDFQKKLRQRFLLLEDLKVIPGVLFHSADNTEQIELNTSLLFEDGKSGLLDQGIPVLDRISAWLKTFDDQPVVIHCLPEEAQDPVKTGDLFLHRYAAVYSFFVEERHLSPSRFVSADLLATGSGSQVSANAPRKVIIQTFGNPAMEMQLLPAEQPSVSSSRWLELSIIASRTSLNPEEGESVDLDIAALTKSGIRSWTFVILPVTLPGSLPVFSVHGKGNVLTRAVWHGLETQTGSFVKAGTYICRLAATDADGYNMNRELMIQVQRTTQDEIPPVKPKPAKHVHHHVKPKPKPAAVAKAPDVSQPASSQPHVLKQPVAGTAQEQPAADDSTVRAIWKQVIQFDPNNSEIKQALKSSLERIAKTLEVYPLQKVRIMGYADVTEDNAKDLAKHRAQKVRDTLVNEYKVNASRVSVAGGQVLSGAVESGTRKVEMSIIN